MEWRQPRNQTVEPPAHHVVLGPKSDKRDFFAGLIFQTAHHHQDYLQKNAPSESGGGISTLTKYGYVYSKLRKWVVVRTFTDHCLALPMYTHSGQGLAHQKADTKDEYVSIRSSKVSRKDYAGPESRWECLVALTSNSHPSSEVSTNSVLHITAPEHHSYGIHCKFQGLLESRSLSQLTRLFQILVCPIQPTIYELPWNVTEIDALNIAIEEFGKERVAELKKLHEANKSTHTDTKQTTPNNTETKQTTPSYRYIPKDRNTTSNSNALNSKNWRLNAPNPGPQAAVNTN